MEDKLDTKKRKIDNTKNVYPCDQCKYSGSRTSLYRHKQSKHEGIRYPCDHCDFTATTLQNVKKHILTNHIKFVCDLCDTAVEFKTLGLLRRHIHLVHTRKGAGIDKETEDRTVSNVELFKQDKDGKAVDSLKYPGQVCYTVQN